MEYFFDAGYIGVATLAGLRARESRKSKREAVARSDLRSSLEVQEPVAISEPTRKWGIYLVCD